MASQKRSTHRDRIHRPATSLEGKEQQMVSLAVDLAERQLRDGTASSQVQVHYLKLGTTRERLEQQRLAQENELLRAKVEQLSSSARNEEILERALKAFRGYAGQEEDYGEDEYYD